MANWIPARVNIIFGKGGILLQSMMYCVGDGIILYINIHIFRQVTY